MMDKRELDEIKQKILHRLYPMGWQAMSRAGADDMWEKLVPLIVKAWKEGNDEGNRLNDDPDKFLETELNHLK